jgi:membrane fusion protein (multidrug efflux system)
MTPPPPEVAAVTVKRGALPLDLEYTGRTAGSREVEVRARVSGILLERRYEEGSAVHKGDVLFRLDPDPFRAAASQARAEATVARARLDQARRERPNPAAVREAGREPETTRRGSVRVRVAAAASRRPSASAKRAARPGTEVRAPIGGPASREARSEGMLRDRRQRIEPAHADRADRPAVRGSTVPEDEAALLRARLASGQELDAAIALDSASPQTRGRLTFVDSAVETASGTVRAVVVPNGESRLVPVSSFASDRRPALNDVVTCRVAIEQRPGHLAWPWARATSCGTADPRRAHGGRCGRDRRGLADGERVFSRAC